MMQQQQRVSEKGFDLLLLLLQQDKKQRTFLVEISGNALRQPFLLATSISGGTTMAGHQWNDWYLVWQVHDRRLVLLERNAGYKSDRQTAAAIKRTYTDRVLASYPIRTRGPRGGYVIDGKSFFARGASLFFGSMGRSRDSSLAKFRARAFQKNTEISVTMPGPRGRAPTRRA